MQPNPQPTMPGTKTIKAFKWANVIFLASALILLTLSIASYYLQQKQKASADTVNRTYNTTARLNEAMSLMMHAEASQRGYLLTGDQAYIQTFTASIRAIPALLSSLDSLIADPEQRNNLQQLSRLLQYRITWLNAMIDSSQSPGFRNFEPLLQRNRKATELTRSQIALMEEREQNNLRLQLAHKKTNERIAAVFILLFSVVSLVLLVISFSWLKQENMLRVASQYNNLVLEKKVEERTRKIREINEKLNQQNETLARKNEELKSFTYIASHDLKEPLRKIATFSGQILHTEQQNLSEQGRFSFERIIASIRQMQNLIESVLTYAQTEQGIEFEMTDLNAVVQEALEGMQSEMRETGARVEYQDLPKLFAIPQQMEQLFAHLFSNSLKYRSKDRSPLISIKAEKLGSAQKGNEGWQLHFSDNGIGFNEKYKDKVFQMFQRLHGKHEYSGTGIGLAICKKIIDNHRGSITVHSKEGEGTEFVMYLPDHPGQ